ncbi:hypothetical protein LTR37_010978 [Vermiconidia calcicola]|uniref:Uncharacterized protein n=1 Tax=Vermiconidia calcicola TaxID=1690605 RepID=A0ACC3N3A3_9PEZI|nr:hypothetical protein LTR37_010978 [Vermiconidia calcicola]
MSRGHVSFEERDSAPQQGQRFPEHEPGDRNGYFSASDRERGDPTSPVTSRRRASLSIRIPPNQVTADTAFTALQYLPMPVLVLSSAKTIVLANEAMGRLLGIDVASGEGSDDGSEDDADDEVGNGPPKNASEVLHGVTLTQLGLDLIQNGIPVFVAWEIGRCFSTLHMTARSKAKKPNLERILVKWAIEGRRKRVELEKSPRKKRPASSRNPSSFASETSSSMQSPQEHLASELDRLEFAHRAAFERSSEAPNDIALKHRAAEEKAISLRDDILMESGTDPKVRFGRGMSDDKYHHAMHGSSTALTAENVEKLSPGNSTSRLKKEEGGLEGEVSSLGATVGETANGSAPLSRVSTAQNLAAHRKPG